MSKRAVKRTGFFLAGVALGLWLGWRGLVGEAAVVAAYWIDGKV